MVLAALVSPSQRVQDTYLMLLHADLVSLKSVNFQDNSNKSVDPYSTPLMENTGIHKWSCTALMCEQPPLS